MNHIPFVDALEPRTFFSAGTASAGPAGVNAGAPTVQLKISPRRSSVGAINSVIFTLTVRDADGIDPSTFDGRDLRITGPSGFVRYARLDDVQANGDGTERIARYKMSAPNFRFNAEDAGTFSVRLMSGAIADTLGNAVRAKTLGTFEVVDERKPDSSR